MDQFIKDIGLTENNKEKGYLLIKMGEDMMDLGIMELWLNKLDYQYYFINYYISVIKYFIITLYNEIKSLFGLPGIETLPSTRD